MVIAVGPATVHTADLLAPFDGLYRQEAQGCRAVPVDCWPGPRVL